MVSDQFTRRSIAYSQNFLRNPRLVQSLVDQATLGSEDFVVEIGPGRGIITEALAGRCRRVIAVEKDGILASRLRERLAAHPNVQIHLGEFLTSALPRSPYKVFASIPFNVTTAIVAKLTMRPPQPSEAHLSLPAEERSAYRFVSLEEAREQVRPRLEKRLPGCLRARASGQTVYLHDGDAV